MKTIHFDQKPKVVMSLNHPFESSLGEYYDHFLSRDVDFDTKHTLTAWIDSLFNGECPKGLIISGPSRSGKSYLAGLLARQIRSQRGWVTDYYEGRRPQEFRWLFDRQGKTFQESVAITKALGLIVIDGLKMEHISHTFPIWEHNPRLLVTTCSPIDLECVSASVTERFDVVTLPAPQEGGTR